MGEEVLVLGGQDGVAEDRRHLVVGDDLAILPRQLDEHHALGVVDVPDRRKLEPDEGLEVREAAPVEVDVVDEPDHGEEQQEQQRQERGREPHGGARAREPQAAGYESAGGLPPRQSSADQIARELDPEHFEDLIPARI